jgi:hypothetical protein
MLMNENNIDKISAVIFSFNNSICSELISSLKKNNSINQILVVAGDSKLNIDADLLIQSRYIFGADHPLPNFPHRWKNRKF